MERLTARLAQVTLTDDARQITDDICQDLNALDHARWVEKHAGIAEDVSDDPSEIEILVAVGQQHGTIGWVDWAGEDEERQVQDMVAEACDKLGLPTPNLPDDLTDQVVDHMGSGPKRGEYVPALLMAVDAQLTAVGLRLLLIDLDSDTYTFAPVMAKPYTALVGSTGYSYDLRSVE